MANIDRQHLWPDSAQAFMSGKLKIAGNMALAQKFSVLTAALQQQAKL